MHTKWMIPYSSTFWISSNFRTRNIDFTKLLVKIWMKPKHRLPRCSRLVFLEKLIFILTHFVGNKVNKTCQIFLKTNISYICSFFGKFDVLCFHETHVLRFSLLLYYCRLALFI